MHALAGGPLDTGLSTHSVSAMSTFWEGVRGLYAPFEGSLKSCSTDVYLHEMPGGGPLRLAICHEKPLQLS